MIPSFFLIQVCPTLIIQPPLASVPSCYKKISQSSVHEFLMQSWFWFVQNCRFWFVMPSKLDLLKTGERDLWCEASLNGIQIFIRRCKANLTGSPNSERGSKQGRPPPALPTSQAHKALFLSRQNWAIPPKSSGRLLCIFLSECWLNLAGCPVEGWDYWSPLFRQPAFSS